MSFRRTSPSRRSRRCLLEGVGDVLLEGHLLLEGDVLPELERDVLLEGVGDVLLEGHLLLEGDGADLLEGHLLLERAVLAVFPEGHLLPEGDVPGRPSQTSR